jgi:hypothetical protein
MRDFGMNKVRGIKGTPGVQIRRYYGVALVVIVFAACMSWIGYGQDIAFHAERVAGLAAEIQNQGIGIYRIYTTVCEGYGYASPLFYGDIFLYPAAFLVVLGIPLGIAFRVMLATIALLAFLSMFCCAKAIWGTDMACFTAYIYAFSPIVFTDIFIRYAVGAGLAYVFLPVVLLGFYRIVIEPKNRRWDWIILSLGMSGLILSHLISAALTAGWLLLLCIVFFRKIWHRKSSILYLVLAALFTAALTAYFTMPLLEQLATGHFSVNDQRNDLSGNMAPLVSLFFGHEYIELLNAIVEKITGIEDWKAVRWFPGAYGYILFFVVGLRLSRKRELKNKALDFCLAMSIFYVILSVFRPVQKLFADTVVSFIQVPWRNLMFYTVFIALAAGMAFTILTGNGALRLVRMGMLTATFGTMVAFGALAMMTVHNGMFPYEELSTSSIGMGEYLPAGVPEQDYAAARGETVQCSDGTLSFSFDREKGYSVLSFQETEENTVFEVPVYMYRGYAVVDENTGESFEPYLSSNGLVAFEIPQGYEGTVKIYYAGTTVQKISDVVSLLMILLLGLQICCKICYIIRDRKRKRIV